MKEQRFFYVPDAVRSTQLPPDETTHALRVLRLGQGDEIFLIDGEGSFHRAVVSLTSNHHCCYEIVESLPQVKPWRGHLHIAMAPTKMMERVEWMAEKATEIGVDEFSFLDCRFSERRNLKVERIGKIITAAVKQSRKAWMPVVNPLVAFSQFIETHPTGARFIAHCYGEYPRHDLFQLLSDPALPLDDGVTVMIGPEGDFSTDEVEMAIRHGFVPVSLGECRLRTETAALSAVMMAQLSLRNS